jgi:GTP-binding protein EngB required for normal cell division
MSSELVFAEFILTLLLYAVRYAIQCSRNAKALYAKAYLRSLKMIHGRVSSQLWEKIRTLAIDQVISQLSAMALLLYRRLFEAVCSRGEIALRRHVNAADTTNSSTDVFIAVMGVTGAGKSSFISKCCGQDIPVGHTLQACELDYIVSPCCLHYTYTIIGTSTVTVYPCITNPDTTVYLVDTPGFDDTNRSDTEVLRELATWLTESYAAHIKLSGIIYLHRISDVRMPGSARRNLLMFKKLCGDNALKNVILGTTMWDRVSESEGVAREEELTSTPDFWGWMVSQGSRVFRHTGV